MKVYRGAPRVAEPQVLSYKYMMVCGLDMGIRYTVVPSHSLYSRLEITLYFDECRARMVCAKRLGWAN